jgi:hypothetical protein
MNSVIDRLQFLHSIAVGFTDRCGARGARRQVVAGTDDLQLRYRQSDWSYDAADAPRPGRRGDRIAARCLIFGTFETCRPLLLIG